LNQVFNIGADTPYTVNDLADHVAKAMGVAPHVRYLDARNEVKHAFSSHDRVRDVFQYHAGFSLEEGLEKMARWARAVGAKRSKRFESVEIMRNMPKSWLEEVMPSGGEILR
jgi:UDP-glucose 4-epimerase